MVGGFSIIVTQRGGRIWIAPEVQYNTRGRTRFFDTLVFAPQMDPADYAFEGSPESVHLKTRMSLQAYNIGGCAHAGCRLYSS